MARDPKARKFSMSWQGGYLSASLGLLEYIWGPNWEAKAGLGNSQTVQVKQHTRQRIVGGPSKTVASHSFQVTRYPRRLSGGSAGGKTIRIEAAGSFWTARLGGSVQNFKAFLASTGKPIQPFAFVTEAGGMYLSGD